MDSSSCGRGWRRKGGPGQPSPVWVLGSMSPWLGLFSSSYSCLTAQVGTGLRNTGVLKGCFPCSAFWDIFPAYLVPSLTSVCVCRFPVPACADPAALPVCISGNNSQTHLHPEQRLQCWRLLHKLVPAEAREPSPVSPVLLLRLR